MSWRRISALVLQDIYMTRREVSLWADLFFFSIINVLVFGLIARHFAGADETAKLYVFSGMLLWEVVRLNQYTVTVTSLWNVWSHNLSNLFIAPISLAEFVMGNVVSAATKTLAVTVPLAVATWLFFDFNILRVGVDVVALAFVDLVLFSCCLGLVLLGLVFRYGTRVQALAWSAVYLFQPLIGVYFPLSALPGPIQVIAKFVPATYAFEAVRNALSGQGAVYTPLLACALLGIVMLALSYWAFSFLHHRSMVVGQFARNDA